MLDPETHTLSKHFTHLVGHEVKFTKATQAPERAGRWVFASYHVVAHEDPTTTRSLIVKAELDLLGSLAGCLVGLPSYEVLSRLKSQTLDELMRDAIYEILNVASGAIAYNCRTSLVEMVMAAVDVKGDAAKVLATPSRKSTFDVVVQGYNGGRFVVLA
jgi:hypothetical protein